MSDRFIRVWVAAWAVIGAAAFVLGFDAIPRMLDYNHAAGVMLGLNWGLLLFAPILCRMWGK